MVTRVKTQTKSAVCCSEKKERGIEKFWQNSIGGLICVAVAVGIEVLRDQETPCTEGVIVERRIVHPLRVGESREPWAKRRPCSGFPAEVGVAPL
jgi:hypothetical protein